ncbi:hypothetical protein E4U21_002368 [Claviceps maximensis]|nr:hypothetical protein E4U21_002368 [Claviceps maximensis]
MKSFALLSFLSVLAAAAPTPPPAQVQAHNSVARDTKDLDARQFGLDITRNDLENGQPPCPKAIFIFARGSTEPGNMGASVGPIVANTLTNQLGKDGIWIQGVGGPYTAGLPENAMPAGSSPAAIAEMGRLFTLANSKCPDSIILAGGYSQGAALAAAAISAASSVIREQIAAAVLFGYTKNQQNNGQIPNYPPDRVKVFCNAGDMVCTGSLFITEAHLNYAPAAANAAPQFLESKVAASASSDSTARGRTSKSKSTGSAARLSNGQGSTVPAPADSATQGLAAGAPAFGVPPMGNMLTSFLPQAPAGNAASATNPFAQFFKGFIPRA